MAEFSRVLEKVTSYSLFLLLATPLVFLPSFFFPAMSPKILWIFLFSEIAFLSFVWLGYTNHSWRLKCDKSIFFFVLYLAILSISSIFGISLRSSFWGDIERNTSLLLWLHLGLVFVVLHAFFRQHEMRIKASFVSILIGLSTVLIFFSSPLFSADVFRLFNSGSTFGNSSFFGTYLLFQIFFSFFLIFSTTKRMRLFGIISCAVFLFTLFSTDARAVIVSVLGGIVLFFALFLLYSRHASRFRRIGGLVLFLLLVIAFFSTIYLGFKQDSFLNTWVVNHGSGSRFVVWDIAWKAAQERPWLGWGPENFRYAFLKHYDPCFGGTFCGGNILFDRAHNIILDTLVESGVLGLSVYLFLLCSALYKTWAAYHANRIDLKIAALITATLVAYFVQNLTVFDTATSLLYFVIFYAFIMRVATSTTQTVASNKSFSPFFPVLATCVLPFTLFFFLIQPFEGITVMKTAVTSLQAKERLDAYAKGLFVSPLGRDVRRDFLGLQTVNLLWSYHPIKDAEYIKKIRPYFSKEIVIVKKALTDTIRRSPNDFRAYLYLTKLFHVEGRLFRPLAFSDAMKLLDEALKKNPKQKVLYWVGVSLLLEQGDIDEASKFASKAIELSHGQKRTLWNVFFYNLYLGDHVSVEVSFTELTNTYPDTKKEAEEFLARDSEERKYEILSRFYYD